MNVVTLLNVLLMCTEHFNQREWVTTTQFAFNVIFTTVFTAEMALKIGASSPKE
jgi:hypothetical protein